MIYFDNAASTKILPASAEKMVEVLTDYYANPGASSVMGMEADNILKDSAKILARLINVTVQCVHYELSVAVCMLNESADISEQ